MGCRARGAALRAEPRTRSRAGTDGWSGALGTARPRCTPSRRVGQAADARWPGCSPRVQIGVSWAGLCPPRGQTGQGNRPCWSTRSRGAQSSTQGSRRTPRALGGMGAPRRTRLGSGRDRRPNRPRTDEPATACMQRSDGQALHPGPGRATAPPPRLTPGMGHATRAPHVTWRRRTWRTAAGMAKGGRRGSERRAPSGICTTAPGCISNGVSVVLRRPGSVAGIPRRCARS